MPDSSTLVKAALASCYGIHAQEISPIRYGVWEECFAVATDRGRLFVKRFLRKGGNPQRMARGLALSQSLRAQGFPAPRLLKSTSGRLIAEWRQERFQVNEWVDGICYEPGELPPAAARAMGAVLGRFHRMLAPAPQCDVLEFPPPYAALADCRALLARYERAGSDSRFAQVAQRVLKEQIALLSGLPDDFHRCLAAAATTGPCFNAFWVEQLLFSPDHEVVALVDWTDGAGGQKHWARDIAAGIHLSALDIEGMRAFAAGYQAENRLGAEDWSAVVALVCYERLASINFLDGWLEKPYRDLVRWERIATRWHTLVPERYCRWREIEAAIWEATGLR